MNLEPTTPVHPEMRALLEARSAEGRVEVTWLSASAARRAISSREPDVQHPAHGRDLNVAGLAMRRYDPPIGSTEDVLLYFHGGGWVLGDLDGADSVCALLAAETNLSVVSVGYRLAPEHPFPAAVQDAVRSVEWATRSFEGRLVLFGESAGGNLAAATAFCLPEECIARVALQVLVYPPVDYRLEGSSFERYGALPYLLTGADLAWFWANYVPNPADRRRPEVSPLRGPLHVMPPTVLLVAEVDPLFDQCMELAAGLRTARIPVDVIHHEGMIHGFFPMVDTLDAARAAVEEVAQRVVDHLSRGAA